MNKDEFKTTINKKVYNLNNAKVFLTRITTQKINEKDARDVYFNLIIPDIDELKNAKGKSINKKNNILNILENLEPVFTGTYFYYNDVPSESKENIAKRIESIKRRLDEIKKKRMGHKKLIV